jgi:hypothetical protein
VSSLSCHAHPQEGQLNPRLPSDWDVNCDPGVQIQVKPGVCSLCPGILSTLQGLSPGSLPWLIFRWLSHPCLSSRFTMEDLDLVFSKLWCDCFLKVRPTAKLLGGILPLLCFQLSLAYAACVWDLLRLLLPWELGMQREHDSIQALSCPGIAGQRDGWEITKPSAK